MDRSNLKISTAAPIIPEKVYIFGVKHVFHRKITRYIYQRGVKKYLYVFCYITVEGLQVLEVAIFLTSC